jgi:hypothetical protein
MTYSAVFPTPRRDSFVLPVLPLVIICLLGGLLAMSLALEGPSVSLAPSQRLPGISDRVRTSFGFVEVQRAVAAASDPVADLVEVRVSVMLHNAAEVPLLFAASQFQLVDSHGHVVPAEAPPAASSQLPPAGALALSYRFLTRGSAQPFIVRFVDPATRRSFDISLAGMECVGLVPCIGGHV